MEEKEERKVDLSYRVGEIKALGTVSWGEDSYLVHRISRVSTHTIGYSVPPIPEGIHQRNSEFTKDRLYLFIFIYLLIL